MWTNILTIIGGTLGITGFYYGSYQLGWYSSRKSQEIKMKQKIIELKQQIKDDTDYELIHKLEEHIEKLKNHKIEKQSTD